MTAIKANDAIPIRRLQAAGWPRISLRSIRATCCVGKFKSETAGVNAERVALRRDPRTARP